MIRGDQALEVLQKCTLFNGIPQEGFAAILPLLKVRQIVAGDPVFLVNEPSDEVYFVYSGQVEVVGLSAQEKILSRLKVFHPGEQFSEFSVLANTPHSTSAFALVDCELLILEAKAFIQVLKTIPLMAENLAKRLSLIHDVAMKAKKPLPYFDENQYFHSSEIPKLVPFEWVKTYGLIPVRYDPNPKSSAESQLSGHLTVALMNPCVPNLFIELQKRAPEVHLSLHLINESDFQRMVAKVTLAYSNSQVSESIQSISNVEPESFEQESNVLEQALGQSLLFGGFNRNQKNQLIPRFKQMHFPKGTLLFEAGTKVFDWIALKSGRIALNDPSHSQVSTVVSKGEIVQELAYLTDKESNVRAIAETDIECYVLDSVDLSKLLNEPNFALAISSHLALRLQDLNRNSAAKFNPSQVSQISKFATILKRDIIEEYKMVVLSVDATHALIGAVDLEKAKMYGELSRALPGHRITVISLSEAEFDLCKRTLFVVNSTKEPGRTQSNQDLKIQFDQLLAKARELKSRDLRIEPFGNQFRFLFRMKEGWIEKHDRISFEEGTKLVARIRTTVFKKEGSSNLSDESKSYRIEIAKNNIHAIISVEQFSHAEAIRIHIVPEFCSEIVIPFQVLVPERKTYARMRESTQKKSGVFVVSGPALSGKSTTLRSIANHLASIGPEKSVISLDPGLCAGPSVTNLNWSTTEEAYRHAIRLRPDVVLFPQPNTSKEMDLVFDAAARGMFALVELESGNSFTALSRLRKFEISSDSLAELLIGISAQTLLPGSCLNCREDKALGWSDLNRLRRFGSLAENIESLMVPKGCEICKDSKITDSVPVFEFWRTNQEIQRALANKASSSEIAAIARIDGFQNMAEFALKLAISGLTTLNSMDRYLTGWDQTAICDHSKKIENASHSDESKDQVFRKKSVA